MMRRVVMSQSQLLTKKKARRKKKLSTEPNSNGQSPTENQRTYLNFSMV
jgi:hypothetical protein|tara:strand:- start:291 stop:437 length:147 start_codon:yes stop_codon:yes gene_type:complete